MGILDWFKKNQESTNFKTPEEYYAWKENWLENKPSEDITNKPQNKQLDNPKAKIADEILNTSATTPIQKLLADIKGKGRDGVPFLNPTYSPSSRIPCADFTSFIKGRLLANDIKSIVTLMQGLFGGIREEDINNLLKFDFNKYINYINKEALTELKSIWIIAEKNGNGVVREFLITGRESFTKYCAVALACQPYRLTENFQLLVKSANNFIKTMRKDVPYWKTFPLYKTNYPTENNITSCEFSDKYNSLTIGGRLHLYESLSHFSQSLTDCSNYNLRSFGVNSIDTIEEIISSDILLTEKCIAKISPFSYLNKKELMKLLDSKNIAYKKSWNTDKLFNAIMETNAKIIDEFMSDKQKERAIIKYQVNSRFKNDIDLLLKSIEENTIVYDLLCFINSKY